MTDERATHTAENAAPQRAEPTPSDRTLRFRGTDPGKHVQSLMPTPLWKRLTTKARAEGISLSRAVMEAVEQWTR